MTADRDPLAAHAVVSHEDWMAARTAFLAKEKEFTQQREELARLRRELPWERVEKNYVFEGAQGKVTLADLFDGRTQLVVYHFMFNPSSENGCKHCSFWADHFDAMLPHLRARDVALAVVSRAPLAKLAAFQKRMGWGFRWVSSFESDFNYDFHVSFTPEEIASKKALYNYRPMDVGGTDREGVSVFCRAADGSICHTYSCHARGIDMLNGTYQYLDIVPKGRDEAGLKSPQDWVRHHDRYES